ncbi:Two-component sensor histidine kinase, contains HisKA and HATPase domains [Palleronia marisminoris]|uniref:sensor histidine kinase n=1 Tax=Palleronia marisminoris TaxID=315423 RepID=UPI0008E49BC5|nr:sensor histidine kinase [Palleronia marisminoris]SFH26469.1 Two-component sensor histidine kinase, contains HisKA and HATPase domains [Palleronia marisminoris]
MGRLSTVHDERSVHPAMRDESSRDRETDHRISNSLQFLAAMLRHESRGATSVASARQSLENAAGRLAAMARLHRQLTAHPADSDVCLGEFIEPICDDICESIGVAIHRRLDHVTLKASQAVQIGIILNELAMNAVKHGDHDGHRVVLTMSAEVMYGRNFALRITDNGSGLPAEFDCDGTAGLGMSIIKSSVDKLGGTMHVLDLSRGAGFEIRVPRQVGCRSR